MENSPINRLLRFCLENPFVVFLFAVVLLGWGYLVAPFNWDSDSIQRDPVPVDAIPDIGENQQIVFTQWDGRSPQDIEDQVTYPLTTALLGLPKVKTVRSFSMFGFSSIYIIFEEDAEFYWSRSRILEKLNSLPSGTLPLGISPKLGPDATALGQVFWYTLEGRDIQGNPAPGWDLDELRSIQDWYVRYALQGVDGVAEVASVGGFVREYQVDVDPAALRRYEVDLHEVFNAVRNSNLDVGARTIEVNAVEYVIRGIGYIQGLDDLRKTVITHRNNVPVTLDQVAEIEYGPAMRRGALDKGGAEAVGGVVVTRFGENPLEVIQRVKDKIAEISPGLPSKEIDGHSSKVEIIPFYDRTHLIEETLGTLSNAVFQQILVTIIAVVILLQHLRSATLVSGVLPLAVLFSFIGMKLFKVDANIVALSGIAIAIGTIVDMGVIMVENILRHQKEAGEGENPLEVVYRACSEVGGAVVTAVLTTIISFLPVFTMEAAEGKLFQPLAYTKTFALAGSIIVSLLLIPPLAACLLGRGDKDRQRNQILFWGFVAIAGIYSVFQGVWAGLALALLAAYNLTRAPKADSQDHGEHRMIVIGCLAFVLATTWSPLGEARNIANLLFVALIIGCTLGLLLLFIRNYPKLLGVVLGAKKCFLGFCGCILLFGASIWLGFVNLFGWMPGGIKTSSPFVSLAHALPGLGKEFMPDLDEGSFLYMPSTMPHASIGESMDAMRKQDMAISAIPEVETAVGKIGRVESSLDPAPVSMVETIINYKSEYITDAAGNILTFALDDAGEKFLRDAHGELIPHRKGKPFRQWRDHIQSPDDIWEEIVDAADILGSTIAPKLQPIGTRILMLQTGMRAPMGIKVFAPDLDTLESTALQLEKLLKELPSIRGETVIADRIVGKPYLEISIDREAIARYGVTIQAVQSIIEVAIGGKTATHTVEGRERYPVRVRYLRELRDNIEAIENILVHAPDGTHVPLKELATIDYVRGPQVIKSEDTFLLGYVTFDKHDGTSEVEVVRQAQAFLKAKMSSDEFKIPAGVSYRFTGSYENQVRAEKKLRVILPLAFLGIWLVLYFQFKRISTTLLVFSGVLFAWSGGFILLWLYGQPWFLDVSLPGVANLRDLFQIDTIHLSVAVWVGFLALFGIATDDGVVFCTYLQQTFSKVAPKSVDEVRQATIEAAKRRIRPAMVTTATTLLALLPILTSTGRGADIMIPMAIPSFGGMLVAILTIFIVPCIYCWIEEAKLPKGRKLDVKA